MSSATDLEQIEDVASIILNNYCIIAAGAFLLYDYAITVDREIASFWHGMTSGATVLFFTNRYLNVVVKIMGLIEFGQFSDEVGGSAASQQLTFTLPITVVRPTHEHWRYYTLSSIFRGPARFSFDLTGTNDPVFGCFGGDSVPKALQLKTSLIAADLLLIVITVWKLPRHVFRFDSFHRARLSLTGVLFRDGIVYFGYSGLTGHSFHRVTAVLVSRFLLDLQEANRSAVGLDTHGDFSTLAEGNSITFAARVVGSLGSTIDYGILAEKASRDTSWQHSESIELDSRGD
ncbi:hypothetical protein C8Q76DRAFT_690679 [Earliella scabrosa]|nr:hypothetical protein C8Q76DRAFT_690679 [Earliella scabrosa]